MAGKLEEALNLAKAELDADPENIWGKRNISWVYYDYLKLNGSPELFDSFISWLEKIKNLQLPEEEKMLYEQLSWQIGKMAFSLSKSNPVDPDKGLRLLNAVQTFHFPKPSEGYSFLFKGLHICLKETEAYTQFADWWDLKNFMPEDFQKEKMPNGKEVMSIAEQAYIAYSKHLLPKQTHLGEIIFDREKASGFLPILSNIVENNPDFLYPAYFQAKLLLALGDKENMLDSLLPFAKKKRSEFWVWQIFAEAFSEEPEKVFACYCKALSCKSAEEMLVGLRQKMAGLLIAGNHFNEAKTEIELLVKSRTENGFKIPNDVVNWQSQQWYKNATTQKTNYGFYKQYIPVAESLLFSDTPEETIIVEFVNKDKKILNFIASETKFGFFKYDRFFKDVEIGETLKVRFQGGSNEGIHQIYTAVKVRDEQFKKQFLKEVAGAVKVSEGKPFGFINDIFINPALIRKHTLINGSQIQGVALKSYNKDKKSWGWKLIHVSNQEI